MLGRAIAFVRAGVPVRRLRAYGRDGADAYDLFDRLERGPARAAAWNAYVCQTYADKLVQAGERIGLVPFDTVRMVRALYALVDAWLVVAQGGEAAGARLDLELPAWGTPVRSREQLVGMRETLYALRTCVAFDLQGRAEPGADLAAVDKALEAVDALWIERPSPELRGGIGDALASGIRKACVLGCELAGGG